MEIILLNLNKIAASQDQEKYSFIAYIEERDEEEKVLKNFQIALASSEVLCYTLFQQAVLERCGKIYRYAPAETSVGNWLNFIQTIFSHESENITVLSL